MADFCSQCSKDMFGDDCRDLAGLISEEKFKEGYMAIVLCEGCGATQVNHLGECLSKDCLEHGHPNHELVAPRIQDAEEGNEQSR